VTAGRLGVIALEPGTYAYVGSAHGPGGLRARVLRHLRRDKPLRWHIDYLTIALPVAHVVVATGDERFECAWVRRLLAEPGACAAVSGFGSSDCREKCPAHLVRLPCDCSEALADLGLVWSISDDG
jgi:Uri superfamily endonuclease